ncbi:MAG TPA: phosphate signaling complex protein PhoU [Mesorhizobium sp.]|jgi:phosphate transport system protein|nr:phosphate signaling complex protein PhoU [Mesorhizobium sp.]
MPSPHIVGSYDAELQSLARRIAAMGGHAERMAVEAVRALVGGDRRLAHKVVRDDEVLDEAERAIGEAAVLTIARRQPIAEDLREIVAAIRIAADLERIGDLAKNIAKRVDVIAGVEQPPQLLRGIEALAEGAFGQLKEVLDAYAARSVNRLAASRERDREIDTMFTSLFQALLAQMAADPQFVTASTHLLFCVKNIERIGDHATNIAETVHLMVTGVPMPIERSKADRSHLASLEPETARP